MNDIKISLDSMRYSSKPDKWEANEIHSRIGRKVKYLNQKHIKSYIEGIGQNGQSFCPVTFKSGENKRENFEQMQLLVLDFNNNDANKITSWKQIKEKARAYNLPILFAYCTFSSTKDNERFRIGFLNNAVITYAKVAEIMLEALLRIFPEADLKAKEISQMYYGGKKLLYFDESIPMINIDSLISNMSLYLYDRYGKKHYKDKIYNFSDRTGLALTDQKMLDVSVIEEMGNFDHDRNGTLSPNTIYIIDSGDKSPGIKLYYRIAVNNGIKSIKLNNVNNSSLGKKKKKIHLPNRSSDLNKIGSVCNLFKEFEDGKRRLNQDELFGLATNLIQFESGSTSFMDIIRTHSYFDDNIKKYADWSYYLNYMKKKDCKSSSCHIYCPYINQCNHATDILSTTKPERHTIIKLANCKEQLYDRDEAAEDFAQKFKIAFETDDNKIHVLNAPTALGKSTLILDYMDNPNLKILIAFPSNDLKNELYKKAIGRGIKAVKTPSLLEVKDKLPSNIWNHIESLYQIGKHHAVFIYIKEVLEKGKVNKLCSDILKEYLKDLTKFYTSDCHVFTTHSRLLTLDHWDLKKYDAIIIDEDIILNCMMRNQVEIPISKLEKILDEIDADTKLAKKILMAVEAAKIKSWFTLSNIVYDSVYDGISTPLDIPSFCHAEKFYFKTKLDENNLFESNQHEDSIVFFKPLKLKHNLKYIMLSATVNQKICNYYFGSNKVTFYNCKKAKYIGTLNQYDKNTMSQSDIDKNHGIIDKIKKFTGFVETITFKKYGKGNCHYGKTTGIDTLKGKNIDVIGTPHQPIWIYKLFAYTMGLRFDENAKLKYQIVRYNEFGFWFMTFDNDNELLRNIQFWMIVSELEQAVGRARLLRENCTVNLFSNFPLKQAYSKKFEYDEELK
jgi:hypothetical protein